MASFKFWKNGKPCQVTLQSGSLTITYLRVSGKQVMVDIAHQYLMAVKSQSNDTNDTSSHQDHLRNNLLHDNDDSNNDSSNSVTVHYARPVSHRRLRVESVCVQSDQRTCELLATALEQVLEGRARPRRVAVVINPNSGKKKGEKIFYKQVQPLFTLCGIDTRVIVTKGPKEARDMLRTVELGDVDGLVTVGGDGLFCEVMTGLLLRTQMDSGVNVHDPEVKVVPSRLPIGLIPAGTGDMVLQYLHGTRDVMTAALRVVLGGHVTTNAVSVHQGEQLSAYAGLVLGFGLQGDMMADCERFRWMGHSRYNVIPVSTVLSRRSHHLEVEYEDPVTRHATRTSAPMYSVDTYVISKQDTVVPAQGQSEGHGQSQGQGQGLRHVFGTDSLTVYMTHKCALSKHVQQLSKLKNNVSGAFDYDFMQSAQVQGYTVRMPHAATRWQDGQKVLKDHYNINCDGEVLRITQPEFKVRLHRHAIRLYGETIV